MEVVRGAWVAKFNPKRAQKEAHRPAANRDVVASDVWWDYKWADPSQAMMEPWIHSWLMHLSEDGLRVVNRGDLVLVMRTEHLTNDVPQLARRTIGGLRWLESISSAARRNFTSLPKAGARFRQLPAAASPHS